MKQVVIIHGGDSYISYEAYLSDLKNSVLQYDRLKPARRWKDEIIDALPAADILTPSMPNSQNAQYEEWKITFEKIIPFFGSDVRLIGHSLGAMFLAKYLHKSPLPAPVRQLILLAGGYDEETEEYGQFHVESATGLETSAHEIHLMHSEDDPVVPYEALGKYERDLPTAFVHRFTNHGHFIQPTFPELLELLKQK